MLTEGYEAHMAARYDADFDAIFGGPDRGDGAFFARVAGMRDGPIAEIGAGTGRVIHAVAEAHPTRACTAIEPSAAMRAEFVAKGTRVPVLDGHFAAIPLPDASQAIVFAAFRSFQHVLDVPGQLASLAEVRRVLRPGGVMAIDLFDPDYGRLASGDWARSATYASGRGSRVERWERRLVARATQVMTVRFRWIERCGERLLSIANDAYRVRYTFRWELEHLMARAGFSSFVIHGSYDERPIDESTRELVVVATR